MRKVNLLVLSLLLSFQLVLGFTEEKRLFGEWMAQHNKFYSTPEEHEKRFNIFLNSLEFVQKHTSEFQMGLQSYEVELNKFSDLTNEEFAAAYFGETQDLSMRNLQDHIPNNWTFPENPDLPSYWNWKDQGIVSHVQDQLGCGCCYAFGAVGAVEGCIALKTNTLTMLSKQNIIDCAVDSYRDNGCHSGSAQGAIEFIIDQGGLVCTEIRSDSYDSQDTEKSYPYQAQEGTCKMKPASLVGTVHDFMHSYSFNETLLQQTVALGPVSASISTDDGFKHYKRGIFVSNACSTKTTNHVILVVGWGVDVAGDEYWIVKNSWGTDWGMVYDRIKKVLIEFSEATFGWPETETTCA